jgi:biopolymer transport protein TolQ
LRTSGFHALALQAQGAQPESGAGGIDFVQLIAHSTWLAKSVLLILLLFSAVSWGIILYKLWQFRRAERNSATFLQVFRKSTKFSEVQAVCSSVAASPLVGIFQSRYAELNAQLRQNRPDG